MKYQMLKKKIPSKIHIINNLGSVLLYSLNIFSQKIVDDACPFCSLLHLLNIVYSLNNVHLFATPGTVAPQALCHGIFQATILEWIDITFSRSLNIIHKIFLHFSTLWLHNLSYLWVMLYNFSHLLWNI